MEWSLPAARELGLGEAVQVRRRRLGSASDETARVDAPTVPFQNTLVGFELVGQGEETTGDASRQSWILGGSTLLTLGALAIGVLLLVRDTARERETNRLRADLVSGVSHELKTPLTLIRVYAETLDSDASPADGDRHAFCEVITRETDRLSGLIDRVLSFSRTDRGERMYHLAPTRITDVVKSTLEGYVRYLQARGFVVRATLDEGLPEVRLDRDALAEAIVNLLDNAAKYSGDSRQIDVRLAGREDSVVLEVADRGIGIPRAEQARVFDRFYRSERQLDRGGYGLGLFLVKHIVDAHGGTVEVESEPGLGSTFRLVFPLNPSLRQA